MNLQDKQFMFHNLVLFNILLSIIFVKKKDVKYFYFIIAILKLRNFKITFKNNHAFVKIHP